MVQQLGLRAFTHGTGFNYKLGNSDLARHSVLSIKKKKDMKILLIRLLYKTKQICVDHIWQSA